MAGFAPLKVSWHEWERAPRKVAQNVALQLSLHIDPMNMTLTQRGLVFAFLYGGTDNISHGTIFINSVHSNDDGTIDETMLRFIPEALSTIGAVSHLKIFERALERWGSKPRKYHPRGAPEDFAAWIRDAFDPVCAEFLDLDEEAFTVRPSLATLLIDLLRQHRKEFVEIVE